MKKIIISFSYIAFTLFFAGSCATPDVLEQQRKTLQQSRQKTSVKKTTSTTKKKAKTPKRSRIAEIAQFNANGDIKSFTEAADRFVAYLKEQKSSIDLRKQLQLNRSLLRFTKALGKPKFATKDHISAVNTVIKTIKTQKDIFTLPSLAKSIERQISEFEKNTINEEAFELYKKEQETRIEKAQTRKTQRKIKKESQTKKKTARTSKKGTKTSKKATRKSKKSPAKKVKTTTTSKKEKVEPKKKTTAKKSQTKTSGKTKKSKKSQKKSKPVTAQKKQEEKTKKLTPQQEEKEVKPSTESEEITPEAAPLASPIATEEEMATK